MNGFGYNKDLPNDLKLIKDNEGVLKNLGKIDQLVIEEKSSHTKNSAMGVVEGIQFFVPLGDLIDIEKEKVRIQGQLQDCQKQAQSIDQRLNNKDFVSKAPEEVVQKDRERLNGLLKKAKELKTSIAQFNWDEYSFR